MGESGNVAASAPGSWSATGLLEGGAGYVPGRVWCARSEGAGPARPPIVPVIGIGDLVIVSCIFYCLKRLDHPDRDSLLVALGGLSAALGVGLTVGGTAAVPFLAGAVTVYLVYRNRRERSAA